MFYDIDILCPQRKGKFAIAWLAATRGISKISNRQIIETDIEALCNEICQIVISNSNTPRRRLSLRLSATLTYGLVKIHQQKVDLMTKDLFTFFYQIRRPLSTSEIGIGIQGPLVAATVGIKRKRKRRVVLSQQSDTPEDAVQTPVLETAETQAPVVVEEPFAILTVDADLITLREELLIRGRVEEGGFGEEELPLETIMTEMQLTPSRAPELQEHPPASHEERGRKRRVTITEPLPAGKRVRTSTQLAISEVLQPPEEELRSKEITEGERGILDIQRPEITDRAPETLEAIEPAAVTAPRALQETQVLPVVKQFTGAQRKRMFVQDKPRRVLKINRCDYADDEIYDIWEKKRQVPFLCPKPREMRWSEMVAHLVAPMLSEDEGFDEVARATSRSLSSRTSSITQAVTRKRSTRPSPLTSSVVPDHTSQETPLVDETRQFSTPLQVDVPPIPQIEITAIVEHEFEVPQIYQEILPAVPTTAALAEISRFDLGGPDAESTGISQERQIEEPIRTDIAQPIAKSIAITEERRVEQLLRSPSSSSENSEKKKYRAKERRLGILRDVKYAKELLTIEDVCAKPINHNHIAQAFGDLLALAKSGHVKLNNKPDSLELGTIEKGEKLLKKK